MVENQSRRAASIVLDAFEVYQSTFVAVTLRAQHRFEQRDQAGAREDAAYRLGLYDEFLDYCVTELGALPGVGLEERTFWAEARSVFSELVEERSDRELAQTFFNSLTRRFHGTVGLDAGIEYFDSDFEIQGFNQDESLVKTYSLEQQSLDHVLLEILQDTPYAGRYRGLRGECQLVVDRIIAFENSQNLHMPVDSIEMLAPVFYRDGMAYLVGRMNRRLQSGPLVTPLVLPLQSTPAGVGIDAVLLTEDEVSILFSFARSYFFVATAFHQQLIQFVQTILPRKRVDEIYSSIGHYRHGKTELHRGLRWHLARSKDRFDFTRGKKGMVMIAFTLPSYDVVFKVIRDRVKPPKVCDRQKVLDCYDLVFKHDRVGRMVDAQEFVNLEFKADRFSEALREELVGDASETVEAVGDMLTIRHLYTERRVTPLDVFIRERSLEESTAAILDYGAAIKELAVANIFPGDLFLKNFGVTRHGRVVFYDYDELCLLTECNFRRFPSARYDYQELEALPWFAVRENDIFPEEFAHFLGIPSTLMGRFMEEHGDLFEVEFWRSTQESLGRGEVIEVLPYRRGARLV
ncbi:MAG: bifunctional isocitrate dehydrogenase kinase/phosphatase [Myxococcota bacterium]|nr:bifunctional isocitrate dehydrogenase kinase/phosphatase [Myxococcota bacterium]